MPMEETIQDRLRRVVAELQALSSALLALVGGINQEIALQTIRNAPLPTRVINMLLRAGYHTVEQVMQEDEAQLRRVRNLGKFGIAQIRAWREGQPVMARVSDLPSIVHMAQDGMVRCSSPGPVMSDSWDMVTCKLCLAIKEGRRPTYSRNNSGGIEYASYR